MGKNKTSKKQDCINDLKSIQSRFPNKKITRDLYRQYGSYSDHFIQQNFGTYGNLIKEANLDISRHKFIKTKNKYQRDQVPLSEHMEKEEDATREDCIEDLRSLYFEHDGTYITRNFYRNNGRYADSIWSQYFGSFKEFVRQAGLALTRQQHRIETQTAKHTSVDHYRSMNKEKAEYAEKYIRENNQRYKTALIITDIHDLEADLFVMKTFIDTIKRIQPEVICIGGDLFDLPEFGKYNVDPREWDVTRRLKCAHLFLGEFREAAPDAQIDLICGNHENRLITHLADCTPAMRSVLADLHGMDLSKLFGLDKYEVNLISNDDLGVWTKSDQKNELKKNYKVYWNSFLVHHFPEGRHLGMPGTCGHHHKLETWSMFNTSYGSYNFYQLGAAHIRQASYTDGQKWSNGFMIAHCDTHTQQTVFEYVDVKDFCCVGGKYYYRDGISVISKDKIDELSFDDL